MVSVSPPPLQPNQPLHIANLQFQARAGQQFLQICLRKSKCNQKRKTYTDIPMIESDHACPVLAMKSYILI